MQKDEKPDLIERYADNGEHSHWELRGRSGILLWTEDEEEKEPIGFNGEHCKSCNGSGFGVIPDSTCPDCNGSGTDFASQWTTPRQITDEEIPAFTELVKKATSRTAYPDCSKVEAWADGFKEGAKWMRDRPSDQPKEGEGTMFKLKVSPQFCPKCNPDTWANNKAQVVPTIQICTSCGYENKPIEEIQKRERAAFYGYIDSILPLIPKHQRKEAEIKLGKLQGKLIGYMDFSE